MSRSRESLPLCYFNPRPREEGDNIGNGICNLGYISIHALVKRATPDLTSLRNACSISIHALVKRATAEQATFAK